MKKALSIIMILVICLSACACGLTKTEDAVVGTWKSTYETTENAIGFYSVGDVYTNTIELYKGGTGKIYWKNETRNEDGSNTSLSWETQDDVININYSLAGSDRFVGYIYNAENDTITSADNKYTFYRQ